MGAAGEITIVEMSLLVAEWYCGDATSPAVSIADNNIAAHFRFSEGSGFFQK